MRHVLREAVGRDKVGVFAKPTGQEVGVDAVATRAGGKAMRVQVTRVERGVWREMARSKKADTEHGTAALADNIRTAIEAKRNTDGRSALVLDLDARRTPGYLFDGVIVEFRRLTESGPPPSGSRRYGSWARAQR